MCDAEEKEREEPAIQVSANVARRVVRRPKSQQGGDPVDQKGGEAWAENVSQFAKVEVNVTLGGWCLGMMVVIE